MTSNVSATTPGRSHCAASLLTAIRLYLNSSLDLTQHWGQNNRNLNDYHSYPMEISRTFWLLDITHWWQQQEETHSKYTDLSNVTCDIFSITPHSVTVEVRVSLGRDQIGWRQSKTTAKTVFTEVAVRQFARANTRLLAGDDPVSDKSSTDNDIEMKRDVEEKKLHWVATVHNCLEMWQGSQNLWATKKEFCAQNTQMTAVEYISDIEEIVKASWSKFQPNGAAAYKLLEKSPLPPALAAKVLPGGQTQVLNISWIKWIDHHPAKSDEDSSPKSVSDTENWLNCNGHLDNSNHSKHDWEADNESDMEQYNSSEESEAPEQRNVSAALKLPGLIWRIQRSQKPVEMALMTVNMMETRRNSGIKNKSDRMRHCNHAKFVM